MKKLKKSFLIFLTISLVIGGLYSRGLTLEKWDKDDPITDEWNLMDLLIVRPMGIGAGIIGTGLFVLTLPFTIPTRGVDDAAKIFILNPFKFSFVREFPDENM